jgi:hypothetical protein
MGLVQRRQILQQRPAAGRVLRRAAGNEVRDDLSPYLAQRRLVGVR